MKTQQIFRFFLILNLLSNTMAFGTVTKEGLNEITEVLKETQDLFSKDNGLLWGRSLDVPILFVDAERKIVFSNRNHPQLNLQEKNGIYTGALPDFVHPEKASLSIGKQNWAVILLPLPKNKLERQCIVVHEAFHCLQPELELQPEPYANNHMDEMEARFWLKLEWKALEFALENEGEERKQAITDAICFRNYRRTLFSKCKGCENRFEIHEGMAEYTAHKICRNNDDFKLYLKEKLEVLWESASFANSFAHFSGPVYAFLLDETKLDWRTHLSAKDDLAKLVQSAYEIALPLDLFLEAEERAVLYKGAQIMGEELDRDVEL